MIHLDRAAMQPYLVRRVMRDGRRAVEKSARDAHDAQAVSRLMHESEILGGLVAPGIARVVAFEAATESSEPRLILEDAGPEDLATLLDSGPLGLGRFLDFAVDMTRIVARVHQGNVLHTRLSPASFVLDPLPDGRKRITLVGFDAATTTEDGSSPEQGAVSAYVAPELTGRLGRRPDPRADLYALGAIFYEMLVGRPPFTHDDPIELIHAHLAKIPSAPASLDANIPPLLSDIVLKLLAKRPEDRYQGADALGFDLEEARRQWRASGTVMPFELARDDLVRELSLPAKLYGRDGALATLSATLERLETRESAVLVIAGPAGVGKSALADVLASKARAMGRFLYAKCDVLAKNRPYASLLELLGKLIERVTDAPESERTSLRARVLRAAPSTARILVDFDRRLERILGETPDVPRLGEPEAESRLHAVLQSFLRAVADDQPLTLFLDDAQWADDATLKFVRTLMVDPEQQGLLVGLAYRTDEVEEDQAARHAVTSAQSAGFPVQHIELGPLDVSAVTAFLADTLESTPEAVGPLGTELHRKTAGNPLFLRRLLHALHRRDLLVYDARAGEWSWDVARIAATPLADDVVDLLLASMGQLSRETQDALATAACFGTQFDLEQVAAVTGQSVEDEARAVWPAIDEGLVIELPAERAPHRDDGLALRFAHDRIQQAAYSLRSPEERKRIHLRIGRTLLARAAPSVDFAVADQLNLATDLLTEPAARIELAELNLRSGERAAAQSAHGPALFYLTHGLALLPDGVWSEHHDLAFRLHRTAATSANMEGELDRSRAIVDAALEQTDSREERAQLFAISIMGMTVAGLYADAVRCLDAALPSFDVERPREDLALAARREMAEATEAIAARGSELLAAPPMRPHDLLVLRLLVSALPASFYVDPQLQHWLSARIVNFTFEHGPASPACFAMTMLALALASARQLPSADLVGLFSVRLAEHLDDPAAAVRASFLHASIVKPWIAPIRACIPLLHIPIDDLLRLGEHQHAPWYIELLAGLQFEQGVELDVVLATVEVGARLTRRLGHSLSGSFFEIFAHDVRRLTGGESAHAPRLDRASRVYSGTHHIVRMQTSYVLGDLAAAEQAAEHAAEFVPALGGLPVCWPEYNLFGALIAAATGRHAADGERRRALDLVRARRDLFDDWRRLCSENFGHVTNLLEAEIALLEERPLDATRLYEQAIDGAERNGFVQYAAIANERCGRLHIELGNRRVAETFLSAATRGYARWGAVVKVQALVREFPRLRIDGRVGSSSLLVDLDVMALLTAAETLASEIDLGRLIDALMRTCLGTAGAERGVLVLEAPAPCVRAVATDAGVSPEQIPLASYPDVPRSIVEEVRLTGRSIVLDDALRSAYADDPDVQARGVRSVLAMPLRRAERETGVLYLENNLLLDAFRPERVRAIDLLSGHLAVALENGLLFEARRNAEAALRFLADASATLAESLDYEATLARVSHLVVPDLAEMCAIDLENDGRVHRVAVARFDPNTDAIVASAGARELELGLDHPVAQVLRTNEAWVRHDIDEATVRALYPDDGEFVAARSLTVKSIVVVPLRARGRTLGTLALVGGRAGSLSRLDLTLVEDLGRRAGLAIDNARLYEETLGTIRKRDEFLALAAHELKTPLTSLQLAIQPLANAELQLSREQIARTASIATRQVSRLTRLVGELLDVSRLRFGKVELVIEDVDLGAVATAAADRLHEDARRANCKFELHTTSAVGRWDRSALDRVVTNLLANAIKFDAGGTIELRVETDERNARLVVTDHGIGIPKDRVGGLFERFERAVSARHYGGLGLGLYISRSIVEGLGGRIRAESEGPGTGATFTVDLPLQPRTLVSSPEQPLPQ